MNNEIHSELLRNVRDAESHLQSHFAEIRTNIRLNAGFHYKNQGRFNFIRGSKVSQDRKIRATKNHTQRIVKKIASSIMDASAGTGIYPKNQSEHADAKSAELNASVWDDIKSQNGYRSFVRQVIMDYVIAGEVFTFTGFNPSMGAILGFDYEKDEEGNRVGEGIPRFKGKVDLRRVPAYNVLTDPSAMTYPRTRWNIIRDVHDTEELKARYANDEEKLSYIDEAKATFQVFDGLSGNYSEMKDQTLIYEIYYRPCAKYPSGHFYFFTNAGILEEGELGISDETSLEYPIQFAGFDETYTSCRAYSVIKTIKPYQMEINRVASAAIMESITLGYTTILSQAGSKVATNSIGNGLRHATYTGSKPDIVDGRNGQQYIEYINQQIDEMYLIANVRDHEKEVFNPSNSNDAFAGLFRAIKDKKKFSYYSEKIEDLLIEINKAALGAARTYYNEEMIIPLIGKDEQINIDEFKNTSPLKHVIKIEPRSEDHESLMGKTLMINQLLQYAGRQLTQEQLGVLAKNLPFLNEDMILDDLTANHDVATNIILALDRNKLPAFSEHMDHAYILRKLTARMLKGDFQFLPDEVKEKYAFRKQQHQEILVKQQQDAQRASSGFIPSGGGLVGVDFYINQDGAKQKRARIPFESVQWLVDKLKSQGTDISKIENLSLGDKADIGRAIGKAMPNVPSSMFGRFNNVV